MIRADQSLPRFGIRNPSAEAVGTDGAMREWPPAFRASRSRAISAGWWLVPSILAGFLLWAMAFRAVFVWIAG